MTAQSRFLSAQPSLHVQQHINSSPGSNHTFDHRANSDVKDVQQVHLQLSKNQQQILGYIKAACSTCKDQRSAFNSSQDAHMLRCMLWCQQQPAKGCCTIGCPLRAEQPSIASLINDWFSSHADLMPPRGQAPLSSGSFQFRTTHHSKHYTRFLAMYVHNRMQIVAAPRRSCTKTLDIM